MAHRKERVRRALSVTVLMTVLWLAVGCEPGQRADDGATVATVEAAAAARWPASSQQGSVGIDPVLTRENYLLVVDMSGSMAEGACAGTYGNKAEAARKAIKRWLRSVPVEANVGLIVFSGDEVRLEVAPGTDNRERLWDAVQAVRPSGSTPLASAVALAHAELEKRGVHQQGYGIYRLVVVTDGAHSLGENPAPVLEDIFANPADPTEVHTIGFCVEDSALNRPGRTLYRSATNPQELSDGLRSVLAESNTFDTIEEFSADE